MGVEKRVTSTLLEASSVEKIVMIDEHIGCAMSGLQADARSLIEHARVESQNHAFHYAEPLRVESCTQAICDLALRFGETGDDEETVMSRPFGVALLIAGHDEDGPQLYVGQPFPLFHLFLCLQPELRMLNHMLISLILGIMLSRRVRSTGMMQRPSVPEVRVRRRNCKTNITAPCRFLRLRRWC